jgi:glycosyltransferase involved in cell wall biosynthesis
MLTEYFVPSLKELPPPPAHKKGWPWTEQTDPLPNYQPDGSEWPRISIVTPSYNQDKFIEETIRSVLLQGYPNLEYIIIDGGSTDTSLDIIKKYEKYITYWISEIDRGQSHAINKGFSIATGEIFAWLNSDDLLKPNALNFVASNLRNIQEPAWLVGASEIIDGQGNFLQTRLPGSINQESLIHWHKTWFPQQSTFWTSSMWKIIRSLNEERHYAMDVELWFSMVKETEPIITNNILSAYRYQENAKTIKNWQASFNEVNYLLEQEFQELKKNQKLNLQKKYAFAESFFYTAQIYYNEGLYHEAHQYIKKALNLQPLIFKNPTYFRVCTKLLLGKKGSSLVKLWKNRNNNLFNTSDI